MSNALKHLTSMNPHFVGPFAQTMMAGRDQDLARRFGDHCAQKAYEFTTEWADNNIPFITPLLKDFAQKHASTNEKPIRYLEIGAYEGRNLAYMDWLMPKGLEITVIDPWFDEDLNPEEKYHSVEPRYGRNTAKMGFEKLNTIKGFSTYELPKMLEKNDQFDLIYIDGSHTAWAVGVDLSYCAALLSVGGMMVMDDYWHQISEIGGPGVKQAVDRFHGIFQDYFDVTAVYRQVALTKIKDIPR